jgi:hypothetical protein
MYIGTEICETQHSRTSSSGVSHTYTRKKTVLIFRCDCCQAVFKRDKGNMDPNRVNDKYYHVCNSCDVKKFAQRKGVEARKIWDMPVSSLKKLSEL